MGPSAPWKITHRKWHRRGYRPTIRDWLSAEQTERIYGRPGLKMRLMDIALIPGASWALFVLRSSVLERYLRTGVSIASLARPITMVDRFIGVENIRCTVSRIMFQNVER